VVDNDLVNGCFEFGGSFALWMHVARLRRDKDIKGAHWLPFAFFFLWGVWNLYYYPSLAQWWSFAGGLFVVGANLSWLVLAARLYTRRAAAKSP
jgi:hypothetical protein